MEDIKRGALFDLDGVLIDSESIYTEFWSGIDRSYPTGVPDFAFAIKGNTLGNILSTYFPDKGIQRLIIKRLQEHEQMMTYRVFDGVTDFLKKLKDHNIPAAIVTSSNEKKMVNMFKSLPGFRDYFDAVITEEDISHSKPHPEGYLLAAQRLGCAPQNCYVFEDSLAGLEAGRRAGAVVIALATTNPHELVSPNADMTIENLTQLDITPTGMISVAHTK